MTGLGFPGDSAGKESACNEGDLSSIPGLGRSPGGGHDNPLQFSGLQSTMDRGAWQATVHGITNSRTWLSGFHFHTFFFHNWLRVWMPPTPPTITYTHTHTHTHTQLLLFFLSPGKKTWLISGLSLASVSGSLWTHSLTWSGSPSLISGDDSPWRCRGVCSSFFPGHFPHCGIT